METLESIVYSYKNNWIGSLVGAISGYALVKYKIKNDNIYVQIGSALLFSVIGSTIEYKIKSSHRLSKTKQEIINN